ncbi:hypothetical protein VNO78_12004 [Psophocarpus tetragonolobus]|uniref:Uncharacterized protein n=1 Tax=Psophocarpus tetragonolobus TaxID=3891 RepID=A0AAN9XNW8_PSOTE
MKLHQRQSSSENEALARTFTALMASRQATPTRECSSFQRFVPSNSNNVLLRSNKSEQSYDLVVRCSQSVGCMLDINMHLFF